MTSEVKSEKNGPNSLEIPGNCSKEKDIKTKNMIHLDVLGKLPKTQSSQKNKIKKKKQKLSMLKRPKAR